jgi:hypothetical protein
LGELSPSDGLRTWGGSAGCIKAELASTITSRFSSDFQSMDLDLDIVAAELKTVAGPRS